MVLFRVVMLILLAIDQYFELCLFGVREKSIDFNSILIVSINMDVNNMAQSLYKLGMVLIKVVCYRLLKNFF